MEVSARLLSVIFSDVWLQNLLFCYWEGRLANCCVQHNLVLALQEDVRQLCMLPDGTYLPQKKMSPRVLLKLDYRNVFNTLRRDHLLCAVKDNLPQLYPFIWQLYSAPSELFFGDTVLQSATGVQQGDPLGPALFSLSIMSLTNSLSSPLNVWYLDDGTLGGTTEEVFSDFSTILCRSSSLGLELNVAKCELFTTASESTGLEDTLSIFRSVAPNIQTTQSEIATLLGAPLTTEALPHLFHARIESLECMISRLRILQAHDALYLLRNFFALPKLLYLLRTSPTWRVSELLEGFDSRVRVAIQEICNIKLDNLM